MKKRILLASGLAGLMLMSGCGSSTSEATPAGTALSGTVAQGEALVAEIVIKGAHGNEATVSSNADGSYSVSSLQNLTAPYIIKATTAEGIVLFSYAEIGSHVANVTPLTSYVVDQAADAAGTNNASYLFNSFSTQADLSSVIDSEIAQLNAVIAAAMGSNGVADFDHFTTSFHADHSGYDGLLDAMDIELMGDDVIIREGGQILETLPYDVTESNITVSGHISNALDDTGLSGVTLSFSNPHHSTSAQTVSGDYSVALEFGRSYDVVITAEGYNTVTFSNLSTFEISNISTQLVPLIPDTVSGLGTVNGSVIDARTGAGIANVTLEFREGLNNRSGSVVATASTNIFGQYDISTVETGNYTIAYRAEGYTTRYVDALVLGGYTKTFNTQLVRESVANENSTGALATIVLEWGENPSDLDSHLTGLNDNATNADDRFKVYFGNKRAYAESYVGGSDFNASQPCLTPGIMASLDLDDVSSYGPETTTICQGYEGTYKFYVHHYSGSGTIASSPATVTVTTMNGATLSWTAPATDVTTVQAWHVFDIDNYGNIIPVNAYIGNDSYAFQSPARNSISHEADIFDNLPAK